MTVVSCRVPARLPVRLLALSLVGLGALTACSTPEPATETPVAEAEAEAALPEAEQPETGPECLIGDWYIAQDQMQAFYSAVSTSSEGVNITVDGGTGLTFTESTYAYTPDFSILLTVAGADGVGSITGGVTGDYTANDTEITTSHDVSAVAVSVTVSGVTIDGTDLFGAFMSSAPINSAPYECTADGPVLQFATGESSPRVPIQLTPAG
ncbi:hypothetical protein [Salinibacterium sp. PAMC 21357]|uniref:hypothetical protein n=1 Tax=Salinibacterium sp. PAMC 21357 TaxID=1112215 RepID=UPI00028919EF|nr:hypothetical protein [Salinibacterium sp. PAMC 21357]